jgi:hypothetical protein
VSYLVVDEMHAEHPELIKDQYWDEVDFEPAYTQASRPSKAVEPYLGSAFSIRYVITELSTKTIPGSCFTEAFRRKNSS